MDIKKLFGAKAQKLVDDGRNWELDSLETLRAHARRGWLLVWIFSALFLVSLIGGYGAWWKMSQPVAPRVLSIDKATGEVQVLELFQRQTVAALSQVIKHWVANYVETRERYIPEQINNDFAATLSMSEAQAREGYQQVYTGSDARHQKIGKAETWTVKILGVTLPPDASGVALVRYEKTVYRGGMNAGKGTFSARVSYHFMDVPESTERATISNPLGFKVSTYISDAELSASASQAK